MTTLSDGDPMTLVGELVESAARDLHAYRVAGPNRDSAARAALSEINAAITLLSEVRQTLLDAGFGMSDDDLRHGVQLRGGWGNSNPGSK